MDGSTRPSRDEIRFRKLYEEQRATSELLREYPLNLEDRRVVLADARALLQEMRSGRQPTDLVQGLFQELNLASPEGIALTSLAEALLRIPDDSTAESLIRDKLNSGDWSKFRSESRTFKLKGLGALVEIAQIVTKENSVVDRVTGGVSATVVKGAMRRMMMLMAHRFVFAPTIEAAVDLVTKGKPRNRYSFDMLGEGARSPAQAESFYKSYEFAIESIGRAAQDNGFINDSTVSIKLSALHPRFEANRNSVLRRELMPLIENLALLAKGWGIGLTIDAEEADRLEPTLNVFEYLARSPRLKEWNGLGLAVQAYSKRARAVLEWLDALGAETRQQFPIRLVKGAYWDAEIKHAQIHGLAEYPVFTRKEATDVSYLACAGLMLHSDRIFPQFATHNAHTVCAIRRMAGTRPFEFQRLHGMGETLYAALEKNCSAPVRVYAPVGKFKELLPYLIRRMLENTANASFVHQAMDTSKRIEDVVSCPATRLEMAQNREISLPQEIYANRKNAGGLDLMDNSVLERLSLAAKQLQIPANEVKSTSDDRLITNPANRRMAIGVVRVSSPEEIRTAVETARQFFPIWRNETVEKRAAALERSADLLEMRSDRFVGLIVAEAGRTIKDAAAEVREAIDFCRYYAVEARRLFGETRLPGVTGERNILRYTGRGVFAAISPWNFPLAIFVGQVAAALVSGNTVVAKAAEQTPLVAAAAVQLMHEAGVPTAALHLVVGGGEVGANLVAQTLVCGVAFTGSNATALAINRALAARDGEIGLLIAETGGINAMFVDSSALLEQVVDDVITSGFLSAGQRCSSLRHLFVQSDVADQLIDILAGAMDTLRIGDPGDPATDVGPLIDDAARNAIYSHISQIEKSGGRVLRQCKLPAECSNGSFVPPTLIEVTDPSLVSREAFGPVVHLTRWDRSELERTLDYAAGTGYGLTLGIHSRIAEFVDFVGRKVHCGNTYVNRNMIGAVVGAQPFGGNGLSGTGPKAGGPNTLRRFATEEVVTVNLTAIGGDIELLNAAGG